MDLEKIGKFIAKKRQENNFTQESLAEELEISNRSISKWERGICLPEAENMTKLCKLFNISYNELLSGEDLKKTDYERKAEENLKEFSKIETEQNKKFLFYENVIGFTSSISFLVLIFTACFFEMSKAATIILVTLGAILLAFGVGNCLKIETEVGKYECQKCGHRYVPKYLTVYFAMHFGRTRYMTCPKCQKKSWQKKIL